MMKQFFAISFAILLLVLLAVGVYLSRTGHTPPGQPVLLQINAQSLAELPAEFNRASGSLRVILLMSPT
jgi:hypothetical protein